MAQPLFRKHELEQLVDLIIDKQQIMLVGAAGAGKTTLINALVHKLSDRRTAFIMSLAFVPSWTAFLASFKTTLAGLANQNGSLFLHLKRFLEDHPYPTKPTKENTLAWLSEFSRGLELTGLDLLFVLEDINREEFLEQEANPFLQALGKGRTTQLLVTASAACNLHNFRSFLLEPITLRHLPPDAGNLEQELLAFAKGNAQFYQELVEASKNHSGFKEVTKAILKRHERHILLFKTRFTAMQWKLLCAIAVDEVVPQPHAFEFLVHHMLGAASSVERALANLKQTGFVVKQTNGWSLSDVVLMRWIQQTHNTTN